MKQYSLFPERNERRESAGTRNRRDFLVTPWNEDFLASLLEEALRDCQGDLSRAVFIFPHGRPEKYFTRLLSQDDRVRLPLILPRFYTVGGLFASLARRITGVAAWEAGLLDRVGLLLDCVRAETADAGLFQALPGVIQGGPGGGNAPALDDARRFFPWGVRLAALFEECFTQSRVPDDFHYTEGQVTPFASRLLERLSGIFARYVTGLAAREWTTPGRDAALVADHLAGNGSLPDITQPGSFIYIAGFHTLTKTEDALFRFLWQEQGGRILLHADPEVTANGGHWSCEPLREWARRWQARLELSDQTAPQTGPPAAPRIRYVEGFDLHSQLQVLRKEMQENLPPNGSGDDALPGVPEGHLLSGDAPPSSTHAADTAVILPDTGLLMPVLHHLPRADINVSMGYPLSRSPLFRLIDTILRLQEGKREHGYYWRDMVELVRHPYLKMLRPLPGRDVACENAAVRKNGISPSERGGSGAADEREAAEASIGLRRELGRFEQTLRGSGRNYQDPFAILEDSRLLAGPGETPAPGVAALAAHVLKTTLSAFERPATPRDLGQALEGLCDLLLTHGRPLWDRFLVDAECLYRLMQSVIPELTHSALAEEEFTPSTLFALVRQLLDAERVPFEATPLVGLQIMGVLESRLLTFRRVFLVDATDDRLPGSPAGDPLLPDALRLELGLPGPHSREQVTAYHFFRLLAGAEEVTLLWQESPDSPGVQDAKKKKSRFVEEMLWEEEKRLGRLLSGQGKDGPLEVLAASVTPLPGSDPAVPVTPTIRVLVDKLLERPVSASLLDAYMRCPLQFFHERVVRLAPAEEIAEGEDPLSVGKLLHSTLQEFYTPLIGSLLPSGKTLPPEALASAHQEMMDIFRSQPAWATLRQSLAADSFTMLETAARERLLLYLRNQPATRVLALETPLTAAFTMPGRALTLTGTADRLDLRAADASQADLPNEDFGLILRILDYKTGRPATPASSLWNNEGLWQRMELWRPERETLAGQPGGRSAGPGQDALLADVAAQLGSVQLPLYLLLFSLAREQGLLPRECADMLPRGAAAAGGAGEENVLSPAMTGGASLGLDAAWVSLGGDGAEVSLFTAGHTEETREHIIRERVPALLRFVIRHLTEATHFFPQPGTHCRWCFYRRSCSVRSTF